MRRALIVLFCLGVLLAGGAAFIASAARLLDQPDAASRADAIVVLAGSYLRPIHAGDLYRQGFAPLVYVSVAVPDPAAAPLAALGVKLVPKEDTYEQTLRASRQRCWSSLPPSTCGARA